MYHPLKTDIADKETELLLDKIADIDMLHEAIGNDDGDLINVLLRFAKADSIDEKLACHDSYMNALKKYFDMESDAIDMLTAQVGYTVRTDVDDYEFITHDTRC